MNQGNFLKKVSLTFKNFRPKKKKSCENGDGVPFSQDDSFLFFFVGSFFGYALKPSILAAPFGLQEIGFLQRSVLRKRHPWRLLAASFSFKKRDEEVFSRKFFSKKFP